MVELPEEHRTAALRRVAEIGERRAVLLAEAHELGSDLQAAAVCAAQAGAQRTRIRDLAGVSSRTLYAWLEEAGLEVRSKRVS